MNRIIIFLFLCALPFTFFAQNYTISGYITDGKSGETLISASVFDSRNSKGAVSNTYGFYSLTLPKGKVEVSYSYVGFTQSLRSFNLRRDTVINIQLGENNALAEIVVYGGTRQELGVKGSQMSAIDVPIEQIKTIPMLFGETDVLKALQLLPGVQSGSEGSAGFYVRGGGPDENLFLLDGVPLYNVNHAAGFFSVFNADAIKSVTLYKGGFPARFGSRLSSVLDVRMNDGNNKKIKANVSVGLISSKLNVEGPLFSENTTFNVSLRRTYFDILIKPVLWYMKNYQDFDKLNAGYYFYDFNAKISHKFDDKNRLYASFYSGDDAIYVNVKESGQYIEDGYKYESSFSQKIDWKWGNLLAVLRWNRVLDSKLFMDVTANYTRYRQDMGIGQKDKESSTDTIFIAKNNDISLKYKSGIDDYSTRIEFDYSPNPDHDIKFGFNPVMHTFRPGVQVAKETSNDIKMDTTMGNQNISAFEIAMYVEDNYALNSFTKINFGLHYSGINVQGKYYHSLQPRLSGRLLLSDKFSLKAGYAYMSQYIHLLSNNNISLPTDLWVPVTKRIKPMVSQQASFGAFYNLKHLFDISIEGYYKEMNNQIEYKDGATFLDPTSKWEDKVATGRGWAYGVEFLVQKTLGNTTGWVGYTWSKSERLFDRAGEVLNFGLPFPAKYDRRHDINIVLSHKFSKKIDVSGTWVYSSGNCGTLAVQEYSNPFNIEDYNYYYGYYGQLNNNPYHNGGESSLSHVEKRNNYRFPAYHRLDLGINFHKKKKYGTRTWNISIYNAYNNMNPFMVYSGYNYNMFGKGDGRKTLMKVTVFTLIPSVSYTYKFE
ncbi:MAG: TonB-dependent receptor [Paludibacter sp.]|jgi:hypothetical protein|nr:TonB-dependent receptor [Paludibacter sp.]